jgi:hypothetical protein
MQAHTFFSIFKVVSSVVLVLMLAAIVYACGIGVAYWSGIGV